MLSVIVIWLYIGITTFIIGYGVLRVITRHLPYCTLNADAYFMCGLVSVTVYAQFFSLFAGVGLWANLLLCAFCAWIVLADRKTFAHTLCRLFCVKERVWNRRYGWPGLWSTGRRLQKRYV